jgi:hypothetical protein
MTDDAITQEAESIVAAFNNASPEYAPELSWYGMTAIRDGGDDAVRRGFVFDTHRYVDQDGLWALRQDGREIEYVEAEGGLGGGDGPRLSIVLPVLGREVRDE